MGNLNAGWFEAIGETLEHFAVAHADVHVHVLCQGVAVRAEAASGFVFCVGVVAVDAGSCVSLEVVERPGFLWFEGSRDSGDDGCCGSEVDSG